MSNQWGWGWSQELGHRSFRGTRVFLLGKFLWFGEVMLTGSALSILLRIISAKVLEVVMAEWLAQSVRWSLQSLPAAIEICKWSCMQHEGSSGNRRSNNFYVWLWCNLGVSPVGRDPGCLPVKLKNMPKVWVSELPEKIAWLICQKVGDYGDLVKAFAECWLA